jgi:hypothetical protein
MGIEWGGRTTDTTWQTSTARGYGIDLRAEMMKILYGDGKQKPQGHIVLVRHMDTVCPCVLEEQGQKYRKPDPNCSVCHGEGYTYTEAPYTAWRSLVGSNSGTIVGSLQEGDPGTAIINGVNFFFDYNQNWINERDKIIEIALETDGSVPTNLGESNHLEKFKIIQRIIHRADNGRIEFVRAICEREEW